MRTYQVLRLEVETRDMLDLDTELTIDLATGRGQRFNQDDTVILSRTATAKLARELRRLAKEGCQLVTYTFEQEEAAF